MFLFENRRNPASRWIGAPKGITQIIRCLHYFLEY
jgi:hypothetical protein